MSDRLDSPGLAVRRGGAVLGAGPLLQLGPRVPQLQRRRRRHARGVALESLPHSARVGGPSEVRVPRALRTGATLLLLASSVGGSHRVGGAVGGSRRS